MKRNVDKIISVICIVIILIAIIYATPINVYGLSDDWTFYVYIVPTDVEAKSGYFSDYYNQMVDGASNGSVRFVVEGGGCASGGNPTYFSKDFISRVVIDYNGAHDLEYLPAASMGAQATINDFMKYMKNDIINNGLDESKTGIIFMGHGYDPIYGFCPDFNYGNDGVTPLELRNAMEANNIHTSLIIFQNCKMASYEVASCITPYTDYIVGSEELIFVEYNRVIDTGVNLRRLGQKVAFTYGISAFDISKYVADMMATNAACYNAPYWNLLPIGSTPYGNVARDYTFSVIDTSKLAEFDKEFTELCKQIYIDTRNKGYDTLAGKAMYYRYFAGPDTQAIDILDVIDAAPGWYDTTNLRNILNELCPFVRNGDGHNDCAGINIYYPRWIGRSWNKGDNDLYQNVAPNEYYAAICTLRSVGYLPSLETNPGSLSVSHNNYILRSKLAFFELNWIW